MQQTIETHLRLACNATVSSGGLGCNGLALERYKKRYAEIHTSAGSLMACLVVCIMYQRNIYKGLGPTLATLVSG